MIGFKLSAPGWTDFEAKITRWRDFDLVALAHRIAAIMIEENAKARLRGIGADGEPLEPIKDTTWERRRRAGKNGGPPLLPDNQSSRAVADASAEVSQLGTSVVRVALHWPTMEPWLRYHRVDVPMGDGVRPARDIVGINPEMLEAILAEVAESIHEAGRSGESYSADGIGDLF